MKRRVENAVFGEYGFDVGDRFCQVQGSDTGRSKDIADDRADCGDGLILIIGGEGIRGGKTVCSFLPVGFAWVAVIDQDHRFGIEEMLGEDIGFKRLGIYRIGGAVLNHCRMI